MEKTKLIAFYLPQYHPIPENDKWWGKGFTEWTNVAKAKPLFKGHKQPKLPADLGFYDLRVPEVREQQAQLAKDHGIYGFCYWHYWFGNGKRVLERPIKEIIASGKPDLPFCLGWANESWSGRWHGLDHQIIIEQTYPGKDDYISHFYEILPAFKDKRYIKIDGKPAFYIYKPQLIPSVPEFINTWQNLAAKEGLGGIFFIAESLCDTHFFDAYVRSAFDVLPKQKRQKALTRLKAIVNSKKKHPRIYKYKDFVNAWIEEKIAQNEYPVVLPNWDNTPRSGNRGFILEASTPYFFKKLLTSSLKKISQRPSEYQIIFIKSWNEWAEGNYLEPDNEFGLAYLETIKDVVALK